MELKSSIEWFIARIAELREMVKEKDALLAEAMTVLEKYTDAVDITSGGDAEWDEIGHYAIEFLAKVRGAK